MSGGLKEQWGVADAAQVGPDAQSQDLKNAFEQAVDAMAEHLQYTAINADGARQNPLAARGQALVPRYQDALKQIDATDPAKAKPAIDSLLADAESLGKDVATFRAEIEKAVNDWQSRSGAYDGAVEQVEELSEWQHPKEAAVRALADAIRGMVNDHAYDKAVSTHDQFLPKLQPVYEDLQKQKAAQQQYEPTIATLQPRLAQVAAPSFAKLAGQQSEIASSQKGMEASAQSKDFVAAVATSTALSSRVDTYTTELQKIQQAKDQYEQAHGPLEAKLQTAAAIPNTFKKLASQQADLTSGKQAMESLAQDEEFEQALASTTELATKVDTYTTELQKLQQAKDQYEQAHGPLEAKLQQTKDRFQQAAAQVDPPLLKARSGPTVPFQELQAQQSEVASSQQAMESAAKDEDYERALALANDLSTKADAFAAGIEKLNERKLETLDRGDDKPPSQPQDPANSDLLGIPGGPIGFGQDQPETYDPAFMKDALPGVSKVFIALASLVGWATVYHMAKEASRAKSLIEVMNVLIRGGIFGIARADAVAEILPQSWLIALAQREVSLKGPLARQHLDHYLAGSGSDFVEDVAALYRQDSGVKQGSEIAIRDAGELSGQFALSQQDFNNVEWQYALGAVDEVHYKLLSAVDDGNAEVLIRIRDNYEWHPDEYRGWGSHIAHVALENAKQNGAKNFWEVGEATVRLRVGAKLIKKLRDTGAP